MMTNTGNSETHAPNAVCLVISRTLYIPPEDRSGWDQLQAQVLYLLLLALSSRSSTSTSSSSDSDSDPQGQQQPQPSLTLVAESFGGCLGLRLAAAAPQLLDALVLVNPATSFQQSMGETGSNAQTLTAVGGTSRGYGCTLHIPLCVCGMPSCKCLS
jgi:hypothetical protein